MKRKRSAGVQWGILLVVYLAILFATTMVVLTSDSSPGFFLLLLAAGVPIYMVTSRAILMEQRMGPILDGLPDAPTDTVAAREGAVAAESASLAGVPGAHFVRLR